MSTAKSILYILLWWFNQAKSCYLETKKGNSTEMTVIAIRTSALSAKTISKPINICDEENENCTEVEYSENRRSEFIVVSR